MCSDRHLWASLCPFVCLVRYVLEALRKPPTNLSNTRMLRFGMFALEQFKSRLPRWPQYCQHILQIPHLREHYPTVAAEIALCLQQVRRLAAPAGAACRLPPAAALFVLLSHLLGLVSCVVCDRRRSAQATGVNPDVVDGMTNPSATEPYAESMAFDRGDDEPAINDQPISPAAMPASSAPGSPNTGPDQRVLATPPMTPAPGPTIPHGVTSVSAVVGAPGAAGATTGTAQTYVPTLREQLAFIDGDMSRALSALAAGLPLPNAGGRGDGAASGSSVSGVATTVAGVPVVTHREILRPPEHVSDVVHLVVNNVTEANVEEQAAKVRGVLTPDYFPWFSNYLVTTRVSTQLNYQNVYRSLLDRLNFAGLEEEILQATYDYVRRLIASEKIRTNTQDRSLLKYLASWLGRITLARNKPILHRDLNVKELLLEGYESGRLVACVAFVAKVLEGVMESRVFRPPNPWVMALLNTLREVYDVPDIKLSIKFEVELLCKHLNIDVKDLTPGRLLHSRRRPVLVGNPDFNTTNSSVRQAETTVPGIVHAETGDDAADTTQIPNLAQLIVVSNGLQLFERFPGLRAAVPVAVDRTIRETIRVVEQAVTIACTTARDLVLKDFITEPDVGKLTAAAHNLVSNLCASLVLATCQEQLRASLSHNLKLSLSPSASQPSVDPAFVTEAVESCTESNLELCCLLFEKAAVDRAIQTIDEAIAPAVAVRRQFAESGSSDPNAVFGPLQPWIQHLPPMLQPRSTTGPGLSASQLHVYESFSRISKPSAGFSMSAVMAAPGAGPAVASEHSPTQVPASAGRPSLSLAAAQEEYALALEKLDAAIAAALTTSGGRSVSLFSLPVEHPIVALLNAARRVGERTVPEQRDHAACVFAQRVLRRMYDGPGDGLAAQVC